MKRLLFAIAAICLLTSYKKKDLQWVAIGDSITYLNDHLTETGNRVTKGYMTRVTEALPNVHYINQGHNGWTSGGIAQSIDKLGLTKADVYSVFLGTNDWWHDRPLGSFADYQNNTGNNTAYGSFRIIINKLKTLNATAKVILITPMQRADFVYISNPKNNAYGSYKEKSGQTLEQFANAVDSIGQYEGFTVVDLFHQRGMSVKNLVKFKRLKDPATGVYKNFNYPAYTSIAFNAGADEYPYPTEAIDVTYDGLHPSDKGNKMIAKRLIKILKKMD